MNLRPTSLCSDLKVGFAYRQTGSAHKLLFEAKVLQDYRNLMEKKWPDLQQYPANQRGRGECKDGSLQTLTTNSAHIFSEEIRFKGLG